MLKSLSNRQNVSSLAIFWIFVQRFLSKNTGYAADVQLHLLIFKSVDCEYLQDMQWTACRRLEQIFSTCRRPQYNDSQGTSCRPLVNKRKYAYVYGT